MNAATAMRKLIASIGRTVQRLEADATLASTMHEESLFMKRRALREVECRRGREKHRRAGRFV